MHTEHQTDRQLAICNHTVHQSDRHFTIVHHTVNQSDRQLTINLNIARVSIGIHKHKLSARLLLEIQTERQ